MQNNSVHPIPNVEVIEQYLYSTSSPNILNLASVMQSLGHGPSFSCSFLNRIEQVRRYFCHGMPIQPSICPEQYFLSISNYGTNCNIKEGPGFVRNSDRKTGPRPFSICLLRPQPPNPKCPTKELKIMDPKASIFNWSLYLFPGYQAIASIGMLVTLPKEAPPIFVNSLKHPFRKVQGY